MSDEQYSEDRVLEETREKVERETAEALADGAAQEVVDEVTEEVASEEVASEEAEEEEVAPASPEEEAIAKLRRKLYMSPGDWYVIHTYSGHERKVKANLEQRITTQNMEDYIFAVEVPDEYVMEYRGTTKKRVRHVRIPGYAIVCMDFNEASYRVVKETPAVTGFVGDQHNPVPLSIDEVVMLLTPNVLEEAAEAAKDQPAPVQAVQTQFEVGEIVTVTDGPFETMSPRSPRSCPKPRSSRCSSPSSSAKPRSSSASTRWRSSSSDVTHPDLGIGPGWSYHAYSCALGALCPLRPSRPASDAPPWSAPVGQNFSRKTRIHGKEEEGHRPDQASDRSRCSHPRTPRRPRTGPARREHHRVYQGVQRGHRIAARKHHPR